MYRCTGAQIGKCTGVHLYTCRGVQVYNSYMCTRCQIEFVQPPLRSFLTPLSNPNKLGVFCADDSGNLNKLSPGKPDSKSAVVGAEDNQEDKPHWVAPAIEEVKKRENTPFELN